MALTFARLIQFLRLPFAIQWRTLLVRLPWLVPLAALYLTSPKGPHPVIIYLPARGKYKIPVYVFLPPDGKLSGVHIDAHGGSFIMGSCLEQAPFCAALARETGRLVMSVDYRKGPLDQFPAAIEDIEDVLSAVLDSKSETWAGSFLRREINKLYSNQHPDQGSIELDSKHLSFSGFSSGGNLALNLVLNISTPEVTWPSLIPNDGPPIPVLLFYPSFDSRTPEHERPRPENLPAPGWFVKSLSGLNDTYLPMDKRAHPRASPGLADLHEGLHARARILLILPELDSLAEQSEIWVSKVKEEGKDHQLVVQRLHGMQHGWTQFPDAFLKSIEIETRKVVFNGAFKFLKEEAGDEDLLLS